MDKLLVISQKRKWLYRMAFTGVIITNLLTGATSSQAATFSVLPYFEIISIESNEQIIRNSNKDYMNTKPPQLSLSVDLSNKNPLKERKQEVTLENNIPIDEPSAKTVALNKTQVSRGSTAEDNLIKAAFSLQGIPYRWGGTTIKGFDCSGFVQYVYAQFGIKLPRTTFEQYKTGIQIKFDKLEVGDLVFFTTYTRGPSDVRMYIGEGNTIGAGNDGVAIHSLSEQYWANRYLGARRVLD